MSSNLPDDVTPADIDRHFGEGKTKTVHGTVSVAVTVEVPIEDTKRDMQEALRKNVDSYEQVLHADIGEVVE